MNKYFIAFILLSSFLLLIVNRVFAEELELAPKAALSEALQSNLQIKATTASIPITEANLIVAKYRPNPIVISNTEIVKGGSLHPIQVGAIIETGKKRYWRMQIANEEISKARLEVEKIIWEIRTQVKIAYADLSVKKEYLELALKRFDFLNSLLASVKNQQKEKTISDIEFERVNLEILRAKNIINERSEQLSISQIDFNRLLHRTLKSTFNVLLAKDLQPKIELSKYPDLDKLIEKALEKRIEVGILEKQYGIVRAQLNRAKNDRIPNVYFEVGPVKPSIGTNVWGPYIGGYTEIPLFNRKQGEIMGAIATQEFLQMQKEKIREDITVEVMKSYKELLLNEEILKTFQNEMRNHSQNLVSRTLDGYGKGLFTLSDVLDAEEKDRDVDEGYLGSILEYQIALARLEYAVGEPIFEF